MKMYQIKNGYPDAYRFIKALRVGKMQTGERREKFPYVIVKLSGRRFLFHKEGEWMPDIVILPGRGDR